MRLVAVCAVMLSLTSSSFVVRGSPRGTSGTSSDGTDGVVCIQFVSSGQLYGASQGSDSRVQAEDTAGCSLWSRPLTVNGYIMDAEQTIAGNFISMDDQFSVPSPPTNQNGGGGGNFIALFPYIQDNNPVIFQPVLFWGCEAWNIFGCVIGGPHWYVQSTICCYLGREETGGQIQVNPGDIIHGTVVQGSLRCGSAFTVTITDVTWGWSNSVTDCTSNGSPLAGPMALEAYNINTCNDLPPSATVRARSITSNPQGNWHSSFWGVNPSCGYQIQFPTPDVLLCWNGGWCGGGGGGCVDKNTPILTQDGYRPVQSLRPGDSVIGYDLKTGKAVSETILSNVASDATQIVSINNDALRLTATDQPTYVQNSTYTGWERNPQNLKIGDSIYNPLTHQWTSITRVQISDGNERVYDLVVDGPKDFIANGYLLLDK